MALTSICRWMGCPVTDVPPVMWRESHDDVSEPAPIESLLGFSCGLAAATIPSANEASIALASLGRPVSSSSDGERTAGADDGSAEPAGPAARQQQQQQQQQKQQQKQKQKAAAAPGVARPAGPGWGC